MDTPAASFSSTSAICWGHSWALQAIIPYSNCPICSLGQVSTPLFKSCSPILSQFISTCITKSVQTGEVPAAFKIAASQFSPREI